MRLLIARLLLLALLLPAGVVRASGIDALHKFIAATSSAQAGFVQKVYNRKHKLTQEASGTLAFLRPGRFRWTYAKPYAQVIVGDGSKVWIYDEDLNQVTVRPLDRALGSTPAALLAGSGEIERAFTLIDQGEKDGLEWVQALPRDKDSNFESIRMGFGPSGLERMELADSFGQTTVLTFTDMRRNPKLDPALFKFVPPKGADVIGAS
ncbi:MAG TPA: outer membrane lipoprotein chaperone LolA [Burkholderiales bacterium]|nr:outer membrane lipoprotein chaperone LolA [Burkholderiales bacterium]